MGKLHEILAVESDLEGNYKRVVGEATAVFRKGEHFSGYTKTLKMFDESRSNEEQAQGENKSITTTVGDKLDYVSDSIIRYFNVVAQKESTNQKAMSDLVVDGQVLVKDAPATLLLGLETKLKQVRAMYEAIPTIAPGVNWQKDGTLGDVWKADPTHSMKTEKIIRPFELSPATKEHPAQVEKLSDTKNVGMYTTITVSGAWSPKEKSDALGRIDKLIRAVKKARQRANMQEVEKLEIGKVLMDFINKS